MNKTLQKAVMQRTKLRNTFLKNRTTENKTNYNNNATYASVYLEKRKRGFIVTLIQKIYLTTSGFGKQ